MNQNLIYNEFVKFKENTNASLTSLQQQISSNNSNQVDLSEIYKELNSVKSELENKINNIDIPEFPELQVTLYRSAISGKPSAPITNVNLSQLINSYNWKLSPSSEGTWYYCNVVVDGETQVVKSVGEVLLLITESIKGEKGDKGDQGIPGPEGPQGIQGPVGPAGPKGESFDINTLTPSQLESIKGEQGEKGDRGLNAYELAVQQGFNGTLSQWLASLKGEKGDTGEKGDKGDKGDTGSSSVNPDYPNVQDLCYVDFDEDMIILSYDENGDITEDSDLKKYYISYYRNNNKIKTYAIGTVEAVTNVGDSVICGQDSLGVYIDLTKNKLPGSLSKCYNNRNTVKIEIAVNINGTTYTDDFKVLQLVDEAEYQLLIPNSLHFRSGETSANLNVKVVKTYKNESSYVSNINAEGLTVKIDGIDFSPASDSCSKSYSFNSSKVILIELWKSGVMYDCADLVMSKDGDTEATQIESVLIFGKGSATECTFNRKSTNIPTGWSRTPNINLGKDEYVWMSTGSIQGGNYCAIDGEGNYWTEPFRVTGLSGDSSTSNTGADSGDINFIYYISENEVAPNKPTFSVSDIENATKDTGIDGWLDHPTGVSLQKKFEYVSVNTKKAGDDWAGWSQPVLWSSYGIQGIDGDGVEYIFCLSGVKLSDPNSIIDKTKKGPNSPAESVTDDDFLPENPNATDDEQYWYDDPRPVSPDNRYQYVSIRKKTWNEDDKASEWGSFSTPTLWSNYALDGQASAYTLTCDNDNIIVDDDSLHSTFAKAAKSTFTLQFNGVIVTDDVMYSLSSSTDDSSEFDELFTPTINSTTGEVTYIINSDTNTRFTNGSVYKLMVQAAVKKGTEWEIVASKSQLIQIKNFNAGDSYKLLVSPNSFILTSDKRNYLEATPTIQVNYLLISSESVTNHEAKLTKDINNLYIEIERNGEILETINDSDSAIQLPVPTEENLFTIPNYYVVNLYYESNNGNAIKVDSETIDLIPSGEKGDSSYSLTLDNDTAILDDTILDNTTYNNTIKVGTLTTPILHHGLETLTEGFELSTVEDGLNGVFTVLTENNKYYLHTTATTNIELGSYYYTIIAKIDNKEVARKRFNFQVSDISPDGSMYSLNITNDSWSYDGDTGNVVSIENSVITVNKITNGIPTSVGFVVNPEDTTNAGLNVRHSFTEETDIITPKAYNVSGYDIQLFYNDVILDSEHIDCIKNGKTGSPGQGIDGVKDFYTVANSNPGKPEDSDLEGIYEGTDYVDSHNVVWSPNAYETETGKKVYAITIYKSGETYSCSGPFLRLPDLSQTIDLKSATIRMRGLWNEDATYVNDEEFIDIVLYEFDGTLSYFKANSLESGENKGQCPILVDEEEHSSINTDYWSEFTEFENVATKVLLSDNILANMTQTGELIVGPNLKNTEVSGLYLGPWENHQGVLADYQDNEHIGEAFKLIAGKDEEGNSSNKLYLGKGLDIFFQYDDEEEGHYMELTSDKLVDSIQSTDNISILEHDINGLRSFVGSAIKSTIFEDPKLENENWNFGSSEVSRGTTAITVSNNNSEDIRIEFPLTNIQDDNLQFSIYISDAGYLQFTINDRIYNNEGDKIYTYDIQSEDTNIVITFATDDDITGDCSVVLKDAKITSGSSDSLIDYVSTEITQTADEIRLEAQATKDGLEAQIELKAGEIQQTVKDDVNKQLATITQTASEISLKVENQGSGNNIFLNSDFGKISDDRSSCATNLSSELGIVQCLVPPKMLENWAKYIAQPIGLGQNNTYKIALSGSNLSGDNQVTEVGFTQSGTETQWYVKDKVLNVYNPSEQTILTQDVTSKVEQGTYYTFSVVAKNNQSGTLQIVTPDNFEMEDYSEGVSNDGTITLNDIDTLYTITYQCNGTATNKFAIKSSGAIALTQIKLEKGFQASEWTLSASETDARLKSTGIDITTGKIDIFADQFSIKNAVGEQVFGVDTNAEDLTMHGIIKANGGYFGIDDDPTNQIYIENGQVKLGSNVKIEYGQVVGLTDSVQGIQLDALTNYSTSNQVDEKIQQAIDAANQVTSTNIDRAKIETLEVVTQTLDALEINTEEINAVRGTIAGFNISDKSISSGTPNNLGVGLRSNNFETNFTIANSEAKNDWRLYIGDKFGVDSNGYLYANGATISADSVKEQIYKILVPETISSIQYYDRNGQTAAESNCAYSLKPGGLTNSIVITIYEEGSYDINKIDHTIPVGVQFDLDRYSNNRSIKITLYNSDCSTVCAPSYFNQYYVPLSFDYDVSTCVRNYGWDAQFFTYKMDTSCVINSYTPTTDEYNRKSYQDYPIFIKNNFIIFNDVMEHPDGFNSANSKSMLVLSPFTKNFGFIGGKVELVFTNKNDSSPTLINDSQYSLKSTPVLSKYVWESDPTIKNTKATIYQNYSQDSSTFNADIWEAYIQRNRKFTLIDKTANGNESVRGLYNVDKLFE